MRRTAARRDSPVRAPRRPARRARGARSSADVALDVRQQRQLARPLDRGRELALVPRAHAGQATRQDLAALRQEPAQRAVVLVVEHADPGLAHGARLRGASHASSSSSSSSSVAITAAAGAGLAGRSEEHTSELQSRLHLVCRLLLEKKKKNYIQNIE